MDMPLWLQGFAYFGLVYMVLLLVGRFFER